MSQGLRAVVVTASLVVLPVAVTWWLASRSDRLPGVTEPVPPVVVRPSIHFDDASQPVELILEWSTPDAVTAPVGFAGFVTRVYVKPGDRVTSGDRVAQVDGVDRLAWYAPAPFHRRLARGAQGADVEELHRLLAASIPDAALDGDLYTSSTATAVNLLAERLGAQAPHGVFEPAWVIWLPKEESIVGSSNLQAGQMAPPTGAVLWEEPSALVSARLVRPGTRDEPGPFDGATWILSVDGMELLRTTSPVIEGPEALTKLASLAPPGTDTLGGVVRRDPPVEVISLPAGAVQASASGATCVWVPDAGGFRPVAVDPRGAGPGFVAVAGLDAESEVLANPAFVLEDPTCRW